MDLTNVQFIEMLLNVISKNEGYSFTISVKGFDQVGKIISPKVYKTPQEAYDNGNKMITDLKKEFKLNETSLH